MKRFEIGKVYEMHSACDWDCVWQFKVRSRTKKFVTLTCSDPITCGNERKVKVREYDGSEECSPLGSYSMSPVLRAESEVVL